MPIRTHNKSSYGVPTANSLVVWLPDGDEIDWDDPDQELELGPQGYRSRATGLPLHWSHITLGRLPSWVEYLIVIRDDGSQKTYDLKGN